VRSPCDALYGYRGEALIGTEHSNAARRIGRSIRSGLRRRGHENGSASLKDAAEADDPREQNRTWQKRGGLCCSAHL
jgi:hypothetical protein